MHPNNIGMQFPQYEGTEGKAGTNWETGESGPRWGTHALAERGGISAKDEPGAKWDRYTALVPVHHLARFAEYDRTSIHANSGSTETIANIASDLRAGGHNAIREPLWIKYDHKNKWGVLVEGNHRLAAAQLAGVTHLPVAMTTRANLADDKRKGVGSSMNIDNRIVEHSGYMPSTVHPGNFKEFEGLR